MFVFLVYMIMWPVSAAPDAVEIPKFLTRIQWVHIGPVDKTPPPRIIVPRRP